MNYTTNKFSHPIPNSIQCLIRVHNAPLQSKYGEYWECGSKHGPKHTPSKWTGLLCRTKESRRTKYEIHFCMSCTGEMEKIKDLLVNRVSLNVFFSELTYAVCYIGSLWQQPYPINAHWLLENIPFRHVKACSVVTSAKGIQSQIAADCLFAFIFSAVGIVARTLSPLRQTFSRAANSPLTSTY